MTDQHKYQSGYIIRMLDLMIMVQYDESFFTIIDPNDLTAVVVDRDPKPRDVSSGSEVIAKCPKESFYIPGKVIKTNLEKGQHFFLIDFWDGVERWSTLQEVRVLTTSKPGGLCVDVFQPIGFERNCVLRRWESETLKEIISHKVDKVN